MYAEAHASAYSAYFCVSLPGLQLHRQLRTAVPRMRIRSVDESVCGAQPRDGADGEAHGEADVYVCAGSGRLSRVLSS